MPGGLDVQMGKERYGKYRPKELKVYRLLAKSYLRFTEGEFSIAVNDGTLLELRQPR